MEIYFHLMIIEPCNIANMNDFAAKLIAIDPRIFTDL